MSCRSGDKEPTPTLCRIIDEHTLFCIPLDKPSSEFEMSVKNAIGYGCFSPTDEGQIIGHHADLHRELKKCD